MRVFVTGATGFVGSAVVKDLLSAGHDVLGLVRSDRSAAELTAVGATPHRGDIEDLDSVRAGAIAGDAVIHTAFSNDFSKFVENCEADRRLIEALGSAVEGTSRRLVITSAVGILPKSVRVTEDTLPETGGFNPRAATEEATDAIVQKGVHATTVRLASSVHGEGDHAFVPMLIEIARKTGVSVYIDDGQNNWPAVHRFDAAALYRLALEKGESGHRYHAVAEEKVPFKDIATAIGRGLGVPVVSKSMPEAEAHFGWFANFVAFDLDPSSDLTQARLGWKPTMPTLLSDLASGAYFKPAEDPKALRG
ncbi:NAD-dependent nucleoside-diphosphate-sugar epimerase protein (plasmid) [Rhizobium sp. Kim5]|uniref:SDR family oxidoreductase n=1 Tax=Rhizobium sp. Kim5 TaxID=2020311 RepID=UPI000A2A2353|nr:SDR family oxidoreductase [Rhizobium sp. Kim5]ARQ62119.1 NAD-dependent nucleoside-diphosphate-sugar epimerase protein [Rhizobium sp. Kim5]